MTMLDAGSDTAARDAVAVAIARAVLAGRRPSHDLLEEFADLDADVGMGWSGTLPGAAFGL